MGKSKLTEVKELSQGLNIDRKRWSQDLNPCCKTIKLSFNHHTSPGLNCRYRHWLVVVDFFVKAGVVITCLGLDSGA